MKKSMMVKVTLLHNSRIQVDAVDSSQFIFIRPRVRQELADGSWHSTGTFKKAFRKELKGLNQPGDSVQFETDRIFTRRKKASGPVKRKL